MWPPIAPERPDQSLRSMVHYTPCSLLSPCTHRMGLCIEAVCLGPSPKLHQVVRLRPLRPFAEDVQGSIQDETSLSESTSRSRRETTCCCVDDYSKRDLHANNLLDSNTCEMKKPYETAIDQPQDGGTVGAPPATSIAHSLRRAPSGCSLEMFMLADSPPRQKIPTNPGFRKPQRKPPRLRPLLSTRRSENRPWQSIRGLPTTHTQSVLPPLV